MLHAIRVQPNPHAVFLVGGNENVSDTFDTGELVFYPDGSVVGDVQIVQFTVRGIQTHDIHNVGRLFF